MSAVPQRYEPLVTAPAVRIVNPDPKYAKVRLIEPTTRGYLYIAGSVEPSRALFVLPSRRRSHLLKDLKALSRQLVEQEAVVLSATVFRAIVMPPTARFFTYVKERGSSLQVPNFDVMILIQTVSSTTLRELLQSPAYAALIEPLRNAARSVRVMRARNIKRIAEVDTTRQGLFLFNHFAAENPDVMPELWEYLASWYVKETGLRNSVALTPMSDERSDYAIVNWARWDVSPLRHFAHQLTKKSFWRYVVGNLEANRAASMPVYCRLA